MAGIGLVGRGGTRLICRGGGGDSTASSEVARPWTELLLEERNRGQEDFVDFGIGGTGGMAWVYIVIRLKRLRERLGVVLGSWGGSPSAGGGGAGGEGSSSVGEGQETSKPDLLVIGIDFRLSEIPKKESCGDDG